MIKSRRITMKLDCCSLCRHYKVKALKQLPNNPMRICGIDGFAFKDYQDDCSTCDKFVLDKEKATPFQIEYLKNLRRKIKEKLEEESNGSTGCTYNKNS